MDYIIDPVILVFLAWAAYRGFKRGLVIMVAALAALVLGIWGAAKFSGLVSEWLIFTLNLSSPYMNLISFTLTFLGIVIGINVAAYIVSRLLDAIALGLMNRLFGSIFSILKTALILSVVFVILNAFNERHDFLPKEKIDESLLYEPLSELAPRLFPFLRFEDIAREIERFIGYEDFD